MLVHHLLVKVYKKVVLPLCIQNHNKLRLSAYILIFTSSQAHNVCTCTHDARLISQAKESRQI